MRSIIVFSLILLVSLSTIQNVNAEGYRPLLVCIQEIGETSFKMTKNQKDIMISEAQAAIKEWETMIKQNERGSSFEKWDIDTKIVKMNEEFPSNCDVNIHFENKAGDRKTLGTTKMVEGRYNVEIYLQEIEICRKNWIDSQGRRFISQGPCYQDSPFGPTKMGAVIRHEFGHSLGLEHYPSPTSPDELSNSPSIMVEISWKTIHMWRITQFDVNRVIETNPMGIAHEILETELERETYSEIVFPDWIKNTAKGWSEGKTSDESFLRVLDYLVSEKILESSKIHSKNSVSQIPQWIKLNVGWWNEDKITNHDFVQTLQFLLKKGIIRL